MPLECCPLWKGASKPRLLCLKTVRADSEQLKESGSTCTQGTRLYCSARLNSPKHLLECYSGQVFPSDTVILEGSSASLLSKNYTHIKS